MNNLSHSVLNYQHLELTKNQNLNKRLIKTLNLQDDN